MVDSGANASVIRYSIIASINHLITPVSSILKMADGRSVETVGELELKVEWKSKKEKITVLVLMELSHDLILGPDWISQIGGISIYPSTSPVNIEPFTDGPSETYRTDQSVNVPPLSLAFLPIPKQNDVSSSNSQCLIVNRSFSANPDAEWVIPNSIITELGDPYYVSILNSSKKTITVQSGQQIFGIELITEDQWPVIGDNVEGEVGSVSGGKSSTPEFLQQTLDTIPVEYRSQMEELLTSYGHLFHENDPSFLKSTTVAEHHTNTEDHQPIRSAPYRVSLTEREAIRN